MGTVALPACTPDGLRGAASVAVVAASGCPANVLTPEDSLRFARGSKPDDEACRLCCTDATCGCCSALPGCTWTSLCAMPSISSTRAGQTSGVASPVFLGLLAAACWAATDARLGTLTSAMRDLLAAAGPGTACVLAALAIGCDVTKSAASACCCEAPGLMRDQSR
jgi:hypothetical protein